MANAQINNAMSDDMVIETTQSRVSCNGGGGALGHPLVYLNMTDDGTVTCPYCSRKFVQTQKSE